MAFNMDSAFTGSQNSSSEISFLEQNFSKLSTEGQSRFKDYLQSLVSLQNTMTETVIKGEEKL